MSMRFYLFDRLFVGDHTFESILEPLAHVGFSLAFRGEIDGSDLHTEVLFDSIIDTWVRKPGASCKCLVIRAV